MTTVNVYGYVHIRDVDAFRYPIKKNTMNNYYVVYKNKNIMLNIPGKYKNKKLTITLYKDQSYKEFEQDTKASDSPKYLYINDDKVKNDNIIFYKSFFE